MGTQPSAKPNPSTEIEFVRFPVEGAGDGKRSVRARAMMSRMNGLIGKPVLIDKLDASLAARISRWIGEDNKRAQLRKRARAEKRAAKRAAKRASKGEPSGSTGA